MSPSSSHCCGFIVAIVVSPSHLSQFRCRCHGVAFVLVVVSLLLSWCRLHVSCGFVVAIVVLPLLSHRCSVVVASLQCCCRSRVIVVPSLLHRHSFIIAVAVSPLSSHCHGFVVVVVLPSSSHCCSVIVTVLSSPLRCRLHIGCSFVVASF